MHIHVQKSILSLLWKAITRSIFNTAAFLKVLNLFSKYSHGDELTIASFKICVYS